jgi:hypothetical protein
MKGGYGVFNPYVMFKIKVGLERAWEMNAKKGKFSSFLPTHSGKCFPDTNPLFN